MLKPLCELAQIAFFLHYLWRAETDEPRLVKQIMWGWIVVLSYDVFVLHCIRPEWVKDIANALDTSVGGIVIYAKYQEPLRRMARKVGAVWLSVSR